MTIDSFQLFKYKAALVGKTANTVNNANSPVKSTKIVVSLKHMSNFWRLLEIPLINWKIHLELNCNKDCILSSAEDSAKFRITDAQLQVPLVSLSTKYNVNLTK